MGAETRYPSLPSITTIECRCFRCGHPFQMPVRPEHESPLHVMLVEEQQRHLREYVYQMGNDLMELARECLDAGVKPEIMRRADKLREILDQWKRDIGEA